jgi:hypothetical protein
LLRKYLSNQVLGAFWIEKKPLKCQNKQGIFKSLESIDPIDPSPEKDERKM